MLVRFITGFSALVAFVAPSALTAGELKPLSQIIGGGDFVESYVPERCAGLWTAMAKWGGEEQLGAEAYEKLLAVAQNLTAIAASLRSEKASADLASSSSDSLDAAMTVAQLYLDRFQSNYTLNGSAWSSDADFMSDMDICTVLSSGNNQ